MRNKIFGLALLVGFSFSCNKDKKYPNTTSYDLQLPKAFPAYPIPDDNKLTVEGVALGKMLFFEKMLSGNSTQSCGSCHHQEFSFTDSLKDLSVGIKGLKGGRNSMPIFNMGFHINGFFWDGRSPLLRDQALKPIQDELEMNETLDNVVKKLKANEDYITAFGKAFGNEEITPFKISLALEQYMNSIVSGNSKFDKKQRGELTLTTSEQRGADLFFTEFNAGSTIKGADCFHCHGNFNFTNNQYLNNGLDSVFTDFGREKVTNKTSDRAKFKVPSLRNIEFSGPFMHDGRFKTLEEVVEHYNSGIKNSTTLDPNMHTIKSGLNLTAQEKTDLVNFMKTLTDQDFLTNTRYK